MKDKILGFITILSAILFFVGVAGIEGAETATFTEMKPWILLIAVSMVWWLLFYYVNCVRKG